MTDWGGFGLVYCWFLLLILRLLLLQLSSLGVLFATLVL